VATAPRQSPRTTESVQESQQEHHRRQSLGNRDGTNSEQTESGGRAEAIFSGGRQRIWRGQRMSAPEPRDRCASSRGSASDDGRRIGQCSRKDQNRSCPGAFAEHKPKSPRGPDTPVVSCSDRSTSQQQQQQQNIPMPPRPPSSQQQPDQTQATQNNRMSHSPMGPQQGYQQQPSPQPPGGMPHMTGPSSGAPGNPYKMPGPNPYGPPPPVSSHSGYPAQQPAPPMGSYPQQPPGKI